MDETIEPQSADIRYETDECDALGGHDARTVVKRGPGDSASRIDSSDRPDSKNESGK